jgi:hypothetical protein
MIDRLAAFIVGEGNWLPIAMAAGFLAAGLLFARTHTPTQRTRVLAAMNLFTGVMLLVMGFGHLLAVTTKLLQGTLRGSPLFFYAIGIAIVVPAWFLLRHTRSILAEGDARQTARLNAWMAVTLGVLGIVNLPLAIPAICNIGYSLHRRKWVGLAFAGVFLAATAFLLIGGLIFMASGQTFEEFNQ